jgi:hypothetical protein
MYGIFNFGHRVKRQRGRGAGEQRGKIYCNFSLASHFPTNIKTLQTSKILSNAAEHN